MSVCGGFWVGMICCVKRRRFYRRDWDVYIYGVGGD